MIVLGRGIILVGDKNVPGGTVMTGSPTDSVFGRAIARIGDTVNCPLHGINKIIEGCPTFTVMGVPVALDGHVSECGCALVSSFQGGNGLSGAGFGGASADGSLISSGQAMNSTRYDEQIQFLLGSGTALAGVAYTLTLDNGEKVHGTTDADGRTARIATDEPRAITNADLEPEQLYCCERQAENASASSKKMEIRIELDDVKTNTENLGSSVKKYTIEDKVRQLTTGEIDMAQKMFRDSVDYSKVKVHKGAYIIGAGENAMTPNGEMYFPGDHYQQDFSKGEDSGRIWFIHEMAHVWQYQLGYSVILAGFKILLRGGYGTDPGKRVARAYKYNTASDGGKSMSEFNMEQQGDLIAHYFEAVYLSGKGSQEQRQSILDLPFLQKVLSGFLRNPADISLLPNTTSIGS